MKFIHCKRCGVQIADLWFGLHVYLHFIRDQVKHTGRFL